MTDWGGLLCNLVQGGVRMSRSVTEKCASAVKKGALYISELPGVVIHLHWLGLQQKAFRSVTKSRERKQREGARTVIRVEAFLQCTILINYDDYVNNADFDVRYKWFDNVSIKKTVSRRFLKPPRDNLHK